MAASFFSGGGKPVAPRPKLNLSAFQIDPVHQAFIYTQSPCYGVPCPDSRLSAQLLNVVGCLHTVGVRKYQPSYFMKKCFRLGCRNF